MVINIAACYSYTVRSAQLRVHHRVSNGVSYMLGCAVIAHRYTYAPPRCRTFIQSSVSLWNDLSDPVFNGVGLAGFKSMTNEFFLA